MSSTLGTRTVLAITVVVIIAAVMAGLVALGSPATARERRFDLKRVEHLAELTTFVNIYHSSSGRLPTALSELERQSEYAARLRDPATAQPYEYLVIDSDVYELCATFQQSSRGGSTIWQHGVGRQCFRRNAKDRNR